MTTENIMTQTANVVTLRTSYGRITITGWSFLIYLEIERRPNMSEKRRDNRGRILHTGEVQLSTGQYRYKYVDNYGDERYCYSWRLDHNDRMLVGKKHTESLREMERKSKQISLITLL